MDVRERQLWQHRSDLLRILAVLWRMAGLGTKKTIAQSLRLAVIRLLRPAEAAARRLILVLARQIVVTLAPFRPRTSAAEGERPGQAAQGEERWTDFALADPMPRWRDSPAGFSAIVRGLDREIDGQSLALRFEALNHALDDLHTQAQRMARWIALRKRARARGKFRSIHPLRPGPPVDLRGAARRRLKGHELLDMLGDAHQLAWNDTG